MKLIQYYILLLFTLIALTVRAQLYPVQVVPTVNAPYSSKLADYANPLGGRMQLQLITTDLNIQNRSVQLHLEIKGNGLKAQSLPILNVRTLRISGGEITSLSQSDLAPYFKPENLQGLSMQQYAQPLPDGVYSFCWRVRDVQSGKWLSGSQCATIYLMLNDPPQLNLPTDNERVAVGNFPNIIFSWTPRHLNATNVTYEFELCELLDPSLDPRFAFEVSRKVLKESDLRMTTLLYDLSKPNLIPGHRYAWRVRAVSTAGLVQNSVFKNDGYSEVHSFVYASDCKVPWGLVVTEESPARIRLQWQGDSAHRQYHIQYRKANVVGAEWFDTNTKGTEAYLTDLEGGETYEARVGASCELPKYGTKPSYTYGAITRFEVKKAPTAADNGINCGAAPEIKITDRKPLASLVVNETFTANDFTVKVLEVSGDNGVFTGKGYVEVPFLANAKLAVSFNNVQINSSHQLIGGVVEADYDKKWGDVNFAENLTGEGKRSQKTLTVSFEIERVETNEKGELIAVGKDGRREVFPGGKDTVITDSTGKVHYINQKGEISEPQILAQGGKPTKENTDGVNKSGEATSITAKGIKVTFENAPNSKYAFDKPTKAEKPYEKIEGKPVPYKAVAFGATEPFIAKVSAQGKEVNIDSLFFKTNNGTKIEAKRDGNNYILQLKGLQSFAVEQVQATIKQGKKYKVAGVFNLVHITPRTVKVTLVPTSVSVKLSEELISRIKEIYTPIAVDLDIAKGSVFDISSHLKEGKLPSENAFGDLSTYSPEQNAIIADYKKANNIDNQQYYVFVTDVLSTSFQEGYMRINGQFGFITPTDSQNTNSIVHTIAHELGHGIFALSHPFKHTADKGKTALLMDYSSGVAFSYPEWKAINDPKVKLYAFQGQSEGEYSDKEYIEKIINRMICAGLNDEKEIPMYHFHKSGTFRENDYTIIIDHKEKINLASYKAYTKKEHTFSKDATRITKDITIYYVNFVGLTIKSESKKTIEDLLTKIKPNDVQSVKKTYEKRFETLWSKIKDKNDFSKVEISNLKEMVLCMGDKITPMNRLSIIKKVLDFSSKENEEDLILDLLQTTNEKDAKIFLPALKKDNDLIKRLIEKLDDKNLFYGNENNNQRLFKELFKLYQKVYPKTKRNYVQVRDWLLGKLADEFIPTNYDIAKEFLDKKEEFTPEEISSSREQIEKVTDSLQKSELYLKLQEKVPYYSQRNNESLATKQDAANNPWLKEGAPAGDIMCNLTSQAMGLYYLGITKPCKDCPEECNQYEQMEDYLECIKETKKLGHRGLGLTREKILNLFNIAIYEYKGHNKVFQKEEITNLLKPHLAKGDAVILSAFGHIVRLQAITDKGLIVDDPYGKVVDFSKGGATAKYKKGKDDYRNDKKSNDNKGDNNLWKWEDLEENEIILKGYEIYSKTKK